MDAKVIFDNKTYDKLKFIALVLLPALATLYFGLGQVWHLPKTEEIVGTITVVDTFLGVLVRLSATGYKTVGGGTDGDLIVNEADGENYLALGINKSVAAMTSKDVVSLRVVDNTLKK